MKAKGRRTNGRTDGEEDESMKSDSSNNLYTNTDGTKQNVPKRRKILAEEADVSNKSEFRSTKHNSTMSNGSVDTKLSKRKRISDTNGCVVPKPGASRSNCPSSTSSVSSSASSTVGDPVDPYEFAVRPEDEETEAIDGALVPVVNIPPMKKIKFERNDERTHHHIAISELTSRSIPRPRSVCSQPSLASVPNYCSPLSTGNTNPSTCTHPLSVLTDFPPTVSNQRATTNPATVGPDPVYSTAPGIRSSSPVVPPPPPASRCRNNSDSSSGSSIASQQPAFIESNTVGVGVPSSGNAICATSATSTGSHNNTSQPKMRRCVGVNTLLDHYNCKATITEPDLLGPCEPGTTICLNGIVWLETTTGVLVVNVTWRGRTYIGTLLDATQHDFAPPCPKDYVPPFKSSVRSSNRTKRRTTLNSSGHNHPGGFRLYSSNTNSSSLQEPLAKGTATSVIGGASVQSQRTHRLRGRQTTSPITRRQADSAREKTATVIMDDDHEDGDGDSSGRCASTPLSDDEDDYSVSGRKPRGVQITKKRKDKIKVSVASVIPRGEVTEVNGGSGISSSSSSNECPEGKKSDSQGENAITGSSTKTTGDQPVNNQKELSINDDDDDEDDEDYDSGDEDLEVQSSFPITCPIEGCEKRFSHQIALRFHLEHIRHGKDNEVSRLESSSSTNNEVIIGDQNRRTPSPSSAAQVTLPPALVSEADRGSVPSDLPPNMSPAHCPTPPLPTVTESVTKDEEDAVKTAHHRNNHQNQLQPACERKTHPLSGPQTSPHSLNRIPSVGGTAMTLKEPPDYPVSGTSHTVTSVSHPNHHSEYRNFGNHELPVTAQRNLHMDKPDHHILSASISSSNAALSSQTTGSNSVSQTTGVGRTVTAHTVTIPRGSLQGDLGVSGQPTSNATLIHPSSVGGKRLLYGGDSGMRLSGRPTAGSGRVPAGRQVSSSSPRFTRPQTSDHQLLPPSVIPPAITVSRNNVEYQCAIDDINSKLVNNAISQTFLPLQFLQHQHQYPFLSPQMTGLNLSSSSALTTGDSRSLFAENSPKSSSRSQFVTSSSVSTSSTLRGPTQSLANSNASTSETKLSPTFLSPAPPPLPFYSPRLGHHQQSAPQHQNPYPLIDPAGAAATAARLYGVPDLFVAAAAAAAAAMNAVSNPTNPSSAGIFTALGTNTATITTTVTAQNSPFHGHPSAPFLPPLPPNPVGTHSLNPTTSTVSNRHTSSPSPPCLKPVTNSNNTSSLAASSSHPAALMHNVNNYWLPPTLSPSSSAGFMWNTQANSTSAAVPLLSEHGNGRLEPFQLTAAYLMQQHAASMVSNTVEFRPSP